jgi:DNA-binding transcriptional LysR family regulator
MDLRRLRYVIKVADERGFTRAAQSLNVSQPTLSQQVRDLELELGVTIFSRNSRQIEMTQVGALVVEQARLVLSATDRLKETVLEYRGLRRGSLHIGVTQTFNALHLSPILNAFAQDHPTIDLLVSELSNDDIVAGIASGDLQLGVGIPLVADIVTTDELYKDTLMFVCHPEHHLAHLSFVAAKNLENEALALLVGKFRTSAAIDAYLSGVSIKPRRVTGFNTFAAILQAVSLGGHAAIVPADVSRLNSINGLRFLRLSPAPPERTVALLHPHPSRSTPASNEMASRIKRAFCRT